MVSMVSQWSPQFMSGRGIKLIMEHRENGAPDAQTNEQKVIKTDAASTAASATSGQSDETKAASDSALPQYGSDMDSGRPAKRPGLLGKLRDSLISGWYTPGERMSQDRACLVISNYTTNIVANLIGGSFYTGLLLLMDADDSFIGTMSMIGVAANMAQMFAPLLLERFTQRKKLLMTVRAITMVINILVVGLIPLAPVPHQAQLTMLGICVAVVNFAGSLISPGLSIWHIQSVPPRVRTSYFSLVTMTVGPIVAICNLGGSAIVDMFKARGNEYGGLMALRIIALALYVVDFCMYAHIKEYPYENAGSKFTLRDLFTLPFKNKLYLRSIAVVFLWNATYNIPGSYYIVYLLKNMNLSYTYITAANLINVPVVLLLTPVWGRFMKGRSPFRVLHGNLLGHETIDLTHDSDTLPLKYEYFAVDAIVLRNVNSRAVTLRSSLNDRAVRVEFPGFDYLLFWTKPGAPYICIEPWCNFQDWVDTDKDITQKPGVIALQPGERRIHTHTIEFIG